MNCLGKKTCSHWKESVNITPLRRPSIMRERCRNRPPRAPKMLAKIKVRFESDTIKKLECLCCCFQLYFCCFVVVELSAVTEDNKVLKQRIQTLESELKK